MEIIFNLTEPFYALTQGLDIIRPVFSFFNLEEGCKAQRSCYLVLFSPHKEYSISQIFKLLGPSLRYCVFFLGGKERGQVSFLNVMVFHTDCWQIFLVCIRALKVGL